MCVSDTIVNLQAGSTATVNELCTIQIICSHFTILGADAVSLQESSDSPPDSAVGSGIVVSPAADGVKDRSEPSHVPEAETEAKISNNDPSGSKFI